MGAETPANRGSNRAEYTAVRNATLAARFDTWRALLRNLRHAARRDRTVGEIEASVP